METVEDRMNLSLDDIIMKSKKTEGGGKGKAKRSDPKKSAKAVPGVSGRGAAVQKSNAQRQAVLAKKRGQQPRAVPASGQGGRGGGNARGGGRAGGRGQGKAGGRGGQNKVPDLRVTINNEKAYQKPKGPPIVYPHQVNSAAFIGGGRNAPQYTQQPQYAARQQVHPLSRDPYEPTGQVVRRSASQQIYGPGGFPVISQVARRDAPVRRRVPDVPFEAPAGGSLMRMDQVYHTSSGLKY